jgi:hypothetical protein
MQPQNHAMAREKRSRGVIFSLSRCGSRIGILYYAVIPGGIPAIVLQSPLNG